MSADELRVSVKNFYDMRNPQSQLAEKIYIGVGERLSFPPVVSVKMCCTANKAHTPLKLPPPLNTTNIPTLTMT